MSAHEYLTEKFNAMGIRHFTADEVLYPGDSDKRLQLNSVPPGHLLDNILPTVAVLDDARRDLGIACRISSGYRNPDYNQAVGGSVRSQHLCFCALDVQPMRGRPGSVRDLWNFLKVRRDFNQFKGGLGIYNSFVHVDTRGHNADWDRRR